jgi:hypothetical protein
MEGLIGSSLKELGYELATQGAARSDLSRMRSVYRRLFAAKFYLKTKTPVGKWLVTRKLYAP